jgi:hypothetical protein
MPADRIELRPGPWGRRERSARVAASSLVLVVALGLLSVALRRVSWLDVLLVAAATLVLVVPAVLLFERVVRRRERVVVTPDTVEKHRGDRVLVRLDRHAPVHALRFRAAMSGQPWGLPKLLLHDGRGHLRLESDRWLSRHDEILDALGLDAPTVDHATAHARVPDAFPLWERRPNLVAGLSVLGLVLGLVALMLIAAILI